jgi:predicted RNase H-like nuclease (RuvC/YqgF family)
VAAINGERIRFGIEEQIRRVVTRKARVPNPTDRWDYDETITHEPTGKLSLVIQAGLWNAYEQRARWSDGKVQRLESLLGDFVAGLMRTAVAIRRQEDERKQREDERERRAREAEQLRKDIQEEDKKLEQLNQWAESWERAERPRRFIAAYAEKSISWSAEKQAQYKAWIEWATKQADRLDPFVSEKPASVLERKQELRSW